MWYSAGLVRHHHHTGDGLFWRINQRTVQIRQRLYWVFAHSHSDNKHQLVSTNCSAGSLGTSFTHFKFIHNININQIIITISGKPCCFLGNKKTWQIPHSKDAHQFPSRWRRPHPAGPAEARQGRWSWSSATWRWQRGRARQQTLGWQERDAQPERGICKRATKRQELWRRRKRRRRRRSQKQEKEKNRRWFFTTSFGPQFRQVEHFVFLLDSMRQFVVIVLLLFPLLLLYYYWLFCNSLIGSSLLFCFSDFSQMNNLKKIHWVTFYWTIVTYFFINFIFNIRRYISTVLRATFHNEN